MFIARKFEGRSRIRLLRFPVHSSTQRAQGQWFRRKSYGYADCEPSFQTIRSSRASPIISLGCFAEPLSKFARATALATFEAISRYARAAGDDGLRATIGTPSSPART